MEEVQYKRWQFCVDVIATRKAYSQVKQGGAEDCGCYTCLNFVALREQVYPGEILALLEQLGVNYTKEIEVYHVTKLESGLHLYGGWLHFVGCFKLGESSKVLVEEDANTQFYTFELEQVKGKFQIGFTEDGGLYWSAFQRKPLVQIEFMVEIPWQLEEAEEPL
jgi:hypothetical protein